MSNSPEINDVKWNEAVKYIADELSITEREEFEKWVIESNNEKFVGEIKHSWDFIKPETFIVPDFKEDNAYSVLEKRIGLSERTNLGRNKFNSIFIFKIAAVLIGCCFFLWSFSFLRSIYFNKKTLAKTITVPNGSKKQLNLPDKSRVWVNSGSELSYNSESNTNQRSVSLTGEAFIEVVPDPNRPFIVDCGDYKVKVLGTSFNIKAYPNDKNFSVFVNEGLVEVTYLDKVLGLIKPGFSIVVNTSNQNYEVEKINIQEVSDWKTNKLIFKRTTFEEIKNTLERQFNVKINLKNERINSCSFTGSFENSNIGNILTILSQTGKFTYTVDSDKRDISISGEGCD